MIVLVGESASGKSTVQKVLCSRYRLSPLVTYTTRPIRENEKDGVDYHFISEKNFEILKHNGRFLETAIYNNWNYGTGIKDCKKDSVAVLTPHGLRNVLKHPEINVCSFYINVPRKDRLAKAALTREDIDEVIRRNISDCGQFDGIEEEVNYTICNDGYSLVPEKIADTIVYLYNLVKERGNIERV